MEEIKTLDIEKFNPPVAQLEKIVSETKLITLDDLGNLAQLKIVKENRMALKNARIGIVKSGKMLRQDALRFQKDVIAKEKELIAIIEPEESRLTELEDKAEEYIEKKKRIELIPQRREHLIELDNDIKVSDEELVAMDGKEYESLCNKVIADKNERERLAIEAEKEKIEKEKAHLAREKEIKEAEDRARQEEREKADRERKEREEETKYKEQEAKIRLAREESEAKERIAHQEREAKEKIDREEQERREKLEREERERIEKQEQLKKEVKFKKWLKACNYTGEGSSDLYLKEVGGEWRIYKLISTYEDN